eukprot:TRINITY_DN260_c0_g2_i1.p1 TRINITY_DN260_c0_g2~~TRINITY_DN260_c0_g2_i1.p1  ORF type:complete len:150 (+),score=20.74 TRINITY_DN260_c0_g2_i1:120-569(+)
MDDRVENPNSRTTHAIHCSFQQVTWFSSVRLRSNTNEKSDSVPFAYVRHTTRNSRRPVQSCASQPLSHQLVLLWNFIFSFPRKFLNVKVQGLLIGNISLHHTKVINMNLQLQVHLPHFFMMFLAGAREPIGAGNTFALFLKSILLAETR